MNLVTADVHEKLMNRTSVSSKVKMTNFTLFQEKCVKSSVRKPVWSSSSIQPKEVNVCAWQWLQNKYHTSMNK